MSFSDSEWNLANIETFGRPYYEGSISDKELVKKSGLLKLLEPGDELMADKGFVIQDLLKPIGCRVTMPAFLSSKTQFAKDELLKSKEIHNVRVRL